MQEKLNKAFMKACYEGDIVKIEILLDAGASVNTHDGTSYAIQYATRNTAILKLFIEKGGLDKDALNQALFSASSKSNIENIQLLLFRSDADVNAKRYGEYAIENAAKNTAMLGLFLQRPCIEKTALDRALCSACQAKNIDSVKLLLDQGASVNSRNDSLYAIEAAANDTEILKLFLEKGGLEARALNEALCAAFSHKNIENAKLLFNAGASVNAHSRGKFAIEEAAGDAKTLQLFLERGGLSETTLNNALKAACYHENIENVKALLNLGADVNSKDLHGYHVINRATRNSEVLKLFIEHKNIAPDTLNQALVDACNYLYLESIKLLLQAGADINSHNGAAISCITNHPEILKLFLEKGVIDQNGLDRALHSACSDYKNMQSAQLLLELGANVNVFKYTYAISHTTNHPETLKLFLNKGGIDNKALDEALFFACKYYPNIQSVNLLLDAGADVNAYRVTGYPNSNKKKVEYALQYAADNNPEILKLFIEKGGISQEAAKAAGITLPVQEAQKAIVDINIDGHENPLNKGMEEHNKLDTSAEA